MKTLLSLIAALACSLTALQPSSASDFYEGKKIRLIVSSTPGGGNDTYSRLIARHIGKHIPGNPEIIVQNMPGAGGLVAADYIYRKAPRDGTVMEQINWNVWNYQVINDPRAKFDFGKMNAIGAAVIETVLIYCRKDRFESFADLRKSAKAGKLATVGVSGRQSGQYILGKITEQVLDTRLFDMVFGYPGARQYSLALRQGEIDCAGNTVGSFRDQLGDMYEAGELVIMVQSGTVDGKRNEEYPDLPMTKELAETPAATAIAEAAYFLGHYGRPYAFPPDVPRDRVELIREAFWNTMKDPAFLKEAKRLHRPIEPLKGAKLQEIWKADLNPSAEKLEIVRDIFAPGK